MNFFLIQKKKKEKFIKIQKKKFLEMYKYSR